MENTTMKNFNYWRTSWHLGLFFVLLFILCFIWYWVIQAESLRELHLKLLQSWFIGFNGMSFISFILGAIQSFVWAYIVAGLWYLAGCCRKN